MSEGRTAYERIHPVFRTQEGPLVFEISLLTDTLSVGLQWVSDAVTETGEHYWACAVVILCFQFSLMGPKGDRDEEASGV